MKSSVRSVSEAASRKAVKALSKHLRFISSRSVVASLGWPEWWASINSISKIKFNKHLRLIKEKRCSLGLQIEIQAEEKLLGAFFEKYYLMKFWMCSLEIVCIWGQSQHHWMHLALSIIFIWRWPVPSKLPGSQPPRRFLASNWLPRR
jgi:hypothetical protein